MKIPNIFVLDKDLAEKINDYLKEKIAVYNDPQQTLLYNHVKNVYEGFEHRNIILLYGPPASGKTFISNKTKEALSKEYDITQIYLPPVDSLLTVTKEIFFQTIDDKIVSALSSNKKIYADIRTVEKFAKPAQEAIDSIFMKYKNNKDIVFVLESYYKYLTFYFQDGSTMDIEFTKK